MIYDRLSNCEQYFVLGDKFKKAFDFLKNTDLKISKMGVMKLMAMKSMLMFKL